MSGPREERKGELDGWEIGYGMGCSIHSFILRLNVSFHLSIRLMWRADECEVDGFSSRRRREWHHWQKRASTEYVPLNWNPLRKMVRDGQTKEQQQGGEGVLTSFEQYHFWQNGHARSSKWRNVEDGEKRIEPSSVERHSATELISVHRRRPGLLFTPALFVLLFSIYASESLIFEP